ncbi:aldehyde dehydrogenase (NADP(+)) [Tritonibacter horizontis]|uniref:Alpha-ketoglutaric semialdehyde dehydrogenase n=1 Tax=Tritonibacter horizontis TaxID=1768241 RepID=A0A132BYD0_9RHOB|nr:aldehyde dehydrogenase (NADP(+)) [Tritonibacter horizontis]KUP93294.1 alpha-ketoglutaric semialdehyde dehydrogenase [Tritonibacter horizontis]
MADSAALTGHHLIAGEWVASSATFSSDPVTGEAATFCSGGAAEIDAAVKAAEEAFAVYGWTDRETRAGFLETIADEIEARGADLTAYGAAETGLPTARLDGERGRTTGQLRMFADHIRKGDYLDRRHDSALTDRAPLPRPDLRMIQRPVGPVGVFGASNFPLAFSTAGGDTAAALAAGCPVVYKGHPGHPATGELVAQAIAAAVTKCGLPAGTFGFVQSNTNEAGEALVRHPLIQAVGFTGSYRGGKALFDIAMSRPVPIPFFGELGSINPVFVLPAALAARGGEIGTGWAGSLTMGVGQFCTNPGVVIVPQGAEGDALRDAALAALAAVGPQPMLTAGTAKGYAAAVAHTAKAATCLTTAGEAPARHAVPAVFEVTGAEWIATPALAEEMFGPAAILIRTASPEETLEVAKSFDGQLTVTLQMDAGDTEAAQALMPTFERMAGRILANGFPTGVEVADAMVHGGPFPASTNFGATSVGSLGIRRFLRPVSFQNIPEALLPGDLRDS